MVEYPKRVETGYQRRSIPFPTDHFVGHPDDFVFATAKMGAYWAQLKAACQRFGFNNFIMGAGVKGTPAHPLIQWVIIARDEHGTDKVIWQLYQGSSPRGTQNLIYSCGEVFKMTAFGAGTIDEQDAIIDTVHFRRQIRKFAQEMEPVIEKMPTSEKPFTTVEELRIAKQKWIMQVNGILRTNFRTARDAAPPDDELYLVLNLQLYSGNGKTSQVVLRRRHNIEVERFDLFSSKASKILAGYGVKDI